MEFILYVILGASVGILSGFFGIGGGFVLTPILLLFGFSPVVAITTSLLYTIGTSLSGIVAHFRMRNIQWKVGLFIAIPGIIATQVAHPFVIMLERLQVEYIFIPSLYILLAGYFSFSLLRNKRHKAVTSDKKESMLIPIFIGFMAGFVSTTLGVGGGFIIVPLTIAYMALKPRIAVGTSLFAVLFIVIAGFLSYISTTSIDYTVSLSLIIGSIIGGQLGALVTRIFMDEEIKKYLGILYAFTVVNMVLKMIGYSNIGLTISLGYIMFLLIMFFIRFLKQIKTKNKIVKGEAS